MKKIAILGCSGSIGTTALNVIRRYPLDFKPVLLANNSNIVELKKLVAEFNPKIAFSNCGYYMSSGEEKTFDKDFLARADTYKDVDIVVNGIVGLAGFAPTLAVIEAGKTLVTANKESFVCGGNVINAALASSKTDLRPIDSEHSTVWQCLGDKNNVKSIILTASGGAFRDFTTNQLADAKATDALRHPNWKMGKKVTVDCATLMNKGMEIIEAKHLFGINEIQVLLHRESIVHSLVEMKDNTLIAGLSYPDMEIPIQYALFYPKRKESTVKRLNLADLTKLSFGNIDEERFPCFGICKKAAKFGDYAGTVLNSANEVLVAKYLEEKIGYFDISDKIVEAFDEFGFVGEVNCKDDIFRIEKEVKEYTLRSI